MKFQLFLDKQVYRCGEVVTGRIECWRTRTFTTYGCGPLRPPRRPPRTHAHARSCVLELCGLEQVRHRLGSSSAYGVRSTQFLSSKVMLGRGPGCAAAAAVAAAVHSLTRRTVDQRDAGSQQVL